MTAKSRPTCFAADLLFPECPRWHAGRLFASDMWARTVYAFDPDGKREVVEVLPEGDEPGGLGFLPDGSLLVVGMFSRVVHRVTGGTRTVHADLTELVPFAANDMIVTSNGTAFVTQLGRAHVNLPPSELVKVRTTPVPVVRVTADGVASAATEGLLGPNGIALDESEQNVFVAEPGARRVMEYQTDGESLSGGAQFAELAPRDGRPAAGPDGICLDRDGAVWWADPLGQRVVRVTRGGQVTDEIAYEDVYPTAVALGGKDRRTLFICLVERVHRDPVAPPPRSRIDAIGVSTPGAGRP